MLTIHFVCKPDGYGVRRDNGKALRYFQLASHGGKCLSLSHTVCVCVCVCVCVVLCHCMKHFVLFFFY